MATTSDTPPFLALAGGMTSVGEGVLPVGRPTCPECLPEVEGGDPEDWSVPITYQTLLKLQKDAEITITASGEFSTDALLVHIAEGGFASGSPTACAKRVVLTRGQTMTMPFSFDNVLQFPGLTCLPLASMPGTIGGGGVGTSGSEEGTTDIVDNTVSEAMCGSTGCLPEELPNENNDTTSDATFITWSAAEAIEKVCRNAAGEYRYTFQAALVVSISSEGPPNPPIGPPNFGVSESVAMFLYTGTFDEARLSISPGIGGPPFADGYTLSPEMEVGEFRGVPIKAVLLTFDIDHAYSDISGTEGTCPSLSYTSYVVTGSTKGTLSASIAETTASPSASTPGGGLTSGGVTTGSLESGGLTSGGLTTGGLTSGGLQTGGLQSGGLSSGGLSSGGLDSGGLETGGL